MGGQREIKTRISQDVIDGLIDFYKKELKKELLHRGRMQKGRNEDTTYLFELYKNLYRLKHGIVPGEVSMDLCINICNN